MKTLTSIKNKIFLAYFILLASGAVAYSGDTKVELRRTVSKEFDIDKYSSVEVSNRYGKVEVRPWNNNKVKIDVTVIAKSADKAAAQSKIDAISLNLSKQANTIIGVTSIETENGWNWSLFGGTKVSYEINYVVSMPTNLVLTVENKYGNIFLPEMGNQVNINLKYGNLEACNIGGALRIDMSYSKGTVGSVGDMTGVFSYSDYIGCSGKNISITAKYSKIILDNATSVTANSKYSEMKLGNIGNVTLEADYDDCKIGNISKATLDIDYTDVKILSIGYSLTADVGYGSLTINSLMGTAKTVRISTKYAPIKILNCAPAYVEINGTYMDANFPANFISKTNVQKGSETTIRGYHGKENALASIVIDSKYGDVDIR
jgi:hypothetical protein